MAKKTKIEFEFDESALGRAERRILEFYRKLSGASAKADEATKRRAAEWMAGGEGAAYRRHAPPGYTYDPIGASPGRVYRTDYSQQRFRAEQTYLRTGQYPEESFTARALNGLRNDNPVVSAGRSVLGTARTAIGFAAGAAGIASVASVLGHSFSSYKSLIEDQETLFKRTGGAWDALGRNLDELGKQLQVSAAEAGKLASSFQRLTGSTDTGLIKRAENAGIMARSLGMSPEAGITAFGRAEFMGLGGTEGKQRQFANLLAETMAEGNMGGAPERVLEDILKHIQGVEENTGSMPSIEALARFGDLRSSMYRSDNPALKGQAGDTAISRMQAIMSGGGGLWNEALLARAFDAELKGSKDPMVAFDFLKGGNMFDTVDSVFHNGDKRSRLDVVMAQLKREVPNNPERQAAILGNGRNPQMMLEFIRSWESLSQDRRADFGEWSKRHKFDFIAQPGAMGGAVNLYSAGSNPEKLKALAGQYLGQDANTSQADRARIEAAMNNPEQLTRVLADVIQKQGEAGNQAENLRAAVTKLENTLTQSVGPKMIDLTTGIAKLSMAALNWFNYLTGGSRGLEGDSGFTGPPSPDNWTINGDAWRRQQSENPSIIDRLGEGWDHLWGKLTAPIGGTNQELWKSLRESFASNPDFYGPNSFLNIGARTLGRIGRYGFGIGDAGASMAAGHYPGEGLISGIHDATGDMAKYGYHGYGPLQDKKGFIVHHTGGRGSLESVMSTFGQRGFPAHYVIDRDGRIHRTLPPGQRGQHIRSGKSWTALGRRLGLSNANTEGVEIIANDDSDVTQAQILAADRLRRSLGYSASQVYGHGEINSHKQSTEGYSAVQAIRGYGDTHGGMPLDLLANLEREKGFPKGSLYRLMMQESSGKYKGYHYPQGPTDPTKSDYGYFGIKKDYTGLSPGFGVSPLRGTSPEEQARFAADYLEALSRFTGSFEGGLAAYHAGHKNWRSKDAHQYVDMVMNQPLPGSFPIPHTNPIESTFPITTGRGAIPIVATLNVQFSDGSTRVVARQPIAGHPATPGMQAQRAFAGAPG